MNKRKKRLDRPLIVTIICISMAIVLMAVLLLINVFVPLRYFTAYTTKKGSNSKGTMRVNYIDVGFGDCTLVELPDGKNMLIDGGNGSYPNAVKVLKYLNSRKVETIDYLICTSVKIEHCGGLSEIIGYKKVKNAYIPYCLNQRINDEYYKFIEKLNGSGAKITVAAAGDGVYNKEYGYLFAFLSPSSPESENSLYTGLNSYPNDANIENASIVTWLEYEGSSFVFSSDARDQAFASIIQKYKTSQELGIPYCAVGGSEGIKLENCKVATVAGHGGKKNASTAWYEELKQQEAVVSVGDSYADYPSVYAIADVVAHGCEIKYTKYEGTIVKTVKKGA